MGKEHHLAERRQAILSAIEKVGQLSVEDLRMQFGVSEVTIRQDLQALHEQNLLLRTRGGAVAISILPELSFEVRQQQRSEKKMRIGRAAAQLIHPGDSVIIDASTTSQAIIPFIKHIPELTIITNSLKAGLSLIRLPDVHVLMLGGSLRRDAVSLVQQPDNAFFPNLNVRIGFFGARGITLDQGLTDVNLEEAQTKCRMAQLCQEVVAVLDGSKWGQMAVVTFAALDKVQRIITDHSAPADLIEAVRRRGIPVVVV